jgi:hypothetical protein
LSLGIVAVAALAAMLVRQRAITGLGGCGTGDGVSYCAMARGKLGRRPFSHRPLVPAIARVVSAALDTTVRHSFLVIALCGFVLTLVAIVALGRRVALRTGIDARKAARIGALAAVLWAVTPLALRFVLLAPVLTDSLGTALLVAWLAALLARSRHRFTWVLAPMVAVLATLAREVNAATIAATCIVALGVHIVSIRRAGATIAATTAALLFDLTRPGLPNTVVSNLPSDTFRYWTEHPGPTLRALLMGVGFALLALLPTVWIRMSRRLPTPRPVVVLLPAAVVPILLSAGGLDLPRLSSPATPVLCVLLSLYLLTTATPVQTLLISALGALFFYEWDVFGVLPRTHLGYTDYFLARGAFRPAMLGVLLAITVTVVVLDVNALRNESRPAGRRSS